MAGRPRIEVEGSWYPVDNRVASGESVFADGNEAIEVDSQVRTTDLERQRIEASEVVRRICELAGFDPDRLASRARDRDTVDARKVIATLGVERWNQSRTALGAVLNKSPDVVRFWAWEGARWRQEDPDYAAKLDDRDERLSASVGARKG